MIKFSAEGMAAIATIKRCMQEADNAFRTLSDSESHACWDFHNEGSSLNHCVRWGLQAAEDLDEALKLPSDSRDNDDDGNTPGM